MKSLLLATLVVMLSQMAHAGPFVSGGGDLYALSFMKTGESVAAWLRSNAIKEGVSVTAEELTAAIESTKVESTVKPLNIDGVRKDAINYPTLSKIIFNRQAWDRLSTAAARSAFVFHEYLGIMQVDDSNYQISRKVLAVPSGDVAEIHISDSQAKKLFLRILEIADNGGLAWIDDIGNGTTAAGTVGVNCTYFGVVGDYQEAEVSRFACSMQLGDDGAISAGGL